MNGATDRSAELSMSQNTPLTERSWMLHETFRLSNFNAVAALVHFPHVAEKSLPLARATSITIHGAQLESIVPTETKLKYMPFRTRDLDLLLYVTQNLWCISF
jgi:hypothetical protein